jgi:predicted small metal-binding protein
MNKFACSDVVPGCTVRWVMADERAIVSAVVHHVASAHGLLALPDDMVSTIRGHIARAV